MRYAMLTLLVAFLSAPLISGCQEKTETDKNPVTGSSTTTHTMGSP